MLSPVKSDCYASSSRYPHPAGVKEGVGALLWTCWRGLLIQMVDGRLRHLSGGAEHRTRNLPRQPVAMGVLGYREAASCGTGTAASGPGGANCRSLCNTGLSPVAAVASAAFWTALWGPVGLGSRDAMDICLVVPGRHVERLEFLDVMLGDRPALAPAETFYQRMLAGDPAEAVDKAEESLKERALSTYDDDVALPGLKLARDDVARGALDRLQTERIKAAVIEVVDDLADLMLLAIISSAGAPPRAPAP
jgi:hypothetical protein